MLAYGLDAAQGFNYVALGAAGGALVALLLIKCVDFPFRTPEENVHVLSLDRFFLPHGTVLFFNLLLFSLVVGLILSRPVAIEFYALMRGGFLLALLAQRFVFRDAELKSEIVSGLILMLAAQFILLGYPESPVAPVLIGLSVGIVGSRFLLFFIKLSRHCKRGTAQSTYFLGWESGLAFGLALGYAVFYGQQNTLLIYVCMGVTTVSLLVYHLFTHAWFIRNKNR